MRDSLVGDGARAPGHPHDPVSFLKQKLCEVGPVLTVIPVINAVFPMHPSIGGGEGRKWTGRSAWIRQALRDSFSCRA